MKRFWCILVAIIMFGGLTVFADDMEVTAEYNYADNTVTVSCKNVPDVNIMLALLLPETTLDDAETLGIENVICHMDRKKAADESVIFTYQFPENTVQGIYTAAVSAEGQAGVIEKKFSVTSEKEINNIYLQLKNAEGSIEIRKILDEKYEAFNIKDSYELCRRYDLCDSVASAVADYDYQNGSPLMLQKMIDETAAKLLFGCINKENISEILAFEKNILISILIFHRIPKRKLSILSVRSKGYPQKTITGLKKIIRQQGFWCSLALWIGIKGKRFLIRMAANLNLALAPIFIILNIRIKFFSHLM